MANRNEQMIANAGRTKTGMSAPRGSVLLFAIVLLAMLAMLGTTFILFVRQSRTVSSNSEATTEAVFTANAGLTHALAEIRLMVKKSPIVARKTFETTDEYHCAVFNPANLASFCYYDTDYYTWDGVNVAGAPPLDIAFWHFENNTTGATGPVLTTYGTADRPMRYTTSLLAAQANSGGEVAIEREVQGSTNDLYAYPIPSNAKIKQIPRVSSVRGGYSVWIADINTRLYAVPQAWGMDTTGVTGTLDTTTISKNIITKLKTLAIMDDLLDSDINKMCAFAPTTTFATFADFSLQLDSVAATYTPSHAETEYYFRTLLDMPAGSLAFQTVGEHPASININTAPAEVIAAAISQIPAEQTGDVFDTLPDRAVAIAKRIVAKRPFLCRMDFEDFLAAHLIGNINEASLGGPYTDPGSLTIPDDSVFNDDTNPLYDSISFVRAIYFAIPRRWGADNTLTEPGLDTFHKPELSLQSYLEIPGVPDNAPEYKATINGLPSYPNFPSFQKARFEYFFADDVNAPRSAALLTPKEFNNFANSICTASYTDDVQKIPANAPGPLDDGDIIIAPGPNGTIETIPQGTKNYIMSEIILGDTSTTLEAGDDEPDFDFDLGVFVIKPGANHVLDTVADPAQGDTVVIAGIAAGGPNGTVDTVLPRGRPSYYSFFDDAAYADNFWSGLNDETKNVTNTTDEFNAAKHMKFYYRLRPSPPNPVPPPLRDPAVLGDLVSWSCYPDVGAERKPGFYQMSFDNWVVPSTDHTYGSGPMLTQGDPDEEDSQKYSSAKRTSGSTGTGDVSWSPQFSYRSRFFGVYVLGRGKIQGRNTPELTPNDAALRNRLKITGERRIEAVYDALKDEILWQRSPLSEKHSLAEP